MPLYIKNDETAALVGELARRLNTSKQDAVRTAVEAKLAALPSAPTFDEKLAAFYARNPPREPTGLPADKAFFDDMSGEFD